MSAGQCQMPIDPPQYGHKTLFLVNASWSQLLGSRSRALVLSNQLPPVQLGTSRPAPGGVQLAAPGNRSPLSAAYNFHASINCLVLFMQEMPVALDFALANAGRSIPAKIAMMAMTTSSSIRVNPGDRRRRCPHRGDVFIGVLIG